MIDDIFKFGEVVPLNSITDISNRTSRVLDVQSPFTFYDFLKNTNEQLTPLQYNDYYLQYINNWNKVKAVTQQTAQQNILERYTELLKDISLNYLTLEERRFITNIDFDDPADIDIVIPFYSKKLREICNFYTTKRETVRYTIQKNSNKSTLNSIEKSIAETITDFLLINDDKNLSLNTPNLNIQNILTSLSVEVEDLYDLYSNYLDLDPTLTADDYNVKTELRRQIFSANINSIESDIFINFDASLKRQIFNTVNVFLSTLGQAFTINYNFATVNLNCKVGDKLFDLVDANKGRASRELLLKKQLIQKYIGSDFYYVKTGSTLTDVTTGVLFRADNPSGNLINRHFPSTATVEEESELYSIRRIGLFFTPDKQGILQFSSPDKRFSVDYNKLQSNKVYIFPDPSRYGNTVGVSKSRDVKYPLIHVEDYSKTINNQSMCFAEGDINTSPYDQSFYSYYSRNQNTFNSVNSNFAKLYSRGVITQYASDIYGNQYGLFKSTSKRQFLDRSTSIQPITSYEYIDGGIIKLYNSFLPEPLLGDNAQWLPNAYVSDYYYNALYDGGVSEITDGLMVRGLSDNVDLTLNYVTSSIQYKDIDGGPIIRDFINRRNKNYNSESTFFIENTLSSSNTTYSINDNSLTGSINTIKHNYGTIYVRDVLSETIQPLLTALQPILYKYNESIRLELESLIETFNTYNDIIFFQTKNYFIIDRIGYTNEIVYTGTSNTYIEVDKASSVSNISEPFFFEDRDYCIISVLSSLSSERTSSLLLPTIYKIDYRTLKLEKIFNEPLDIFINKLPIKVVKITKPVLTYNTRNNLYAINATLLDLNNIPYLYQILFTYNDQDVTIRSVVATKFNGSVISNTLNWYDTSVSSLTASIINPPTVNKTQGYIEMYE